jgi:hypothetical protein
MASFSVRNSMNNSILDNSGVTRTSIALKKSKKSSSSGSLNEELDEEPSYYDIPEVIKQKHVESTIQK